MHPIAYPAGAKVRAPEICRDPKTGQPGLLPIDRSTWYRWIKDGRVPQGQLIGQRTRVWDVEAVLALGGAAPEQSS
jgi:prophage regulatory protein